MMRRVLALAVACLMLSGCGPVRTEPWDNEVAQTDGPEIAYVPLDDRPDNVERVVYLAESLGYTLSIPERDDYRTALDGQPCNENGTQSGDRGELFRWLLDREAAECDRYVLSMDQLLSGGLVNSRAMYNHEDISLPGAEGGEMAETYSEYELMGLLLSTLAEDADNQVWLLESVMRLAPTVGYQGGTLEDYNALRSYGAQPRPELAGEVRIHGGEGVGRVTKPGLDQPVGEAAINHVPRAMIKEALEKEAESAGYAGGFDVTISIEGGAETAKRTFNPHMGVEGGLSVLGTSGIVEPMSQQAILDTIQLEMGQAALRAGTPRRLILAPGNYGLDYLHENLPGLKCIPVVKTSNFIGDALDMAAASKFEQVVLVGHIGKLVKLAGGVMNTHSRTADCRTELLCAHAALCGASRDVCASLMGAATTDACMEILDKAELREPVLSSLLDAIQLHLDRRAAGAFRVGAVLFSNQYGPLGQTKTAKELLDEWKNGTASCTASV